MEHEGTSLGQDLLERAKPRLRGPARHLLVVEHIARGQPREEGNLGLVRARRRAAERGAQRGEQLSQLRHVQHAADADAALELHAGQHSFELRL